MNTYCIYCEAASELSASNGCAQQEGLQSHHSTVWLAGWQLLSVAIADCTSNKLSSKGFAACSAIALPPTDYPLWDSIPEQIVEEGKLSQLQLEGVLYACSKHQQFLPSGERAGFFIGDVSFPVLLTQLHRRLV